MGPRIPKGGLIRAAGDHVRAVARQLEHSSKQLRSLSEQKKVPRIGELFLYCRTALMLLTIVTFVEQDAELGQLRQVIGQLQEEEKKASGQVEKLAEELKGE